MTDIATVWDVPNLRGDYVLDGPALKSDADLDTAYLISIFSDRRANPDDKIPDGTGDPRGSCCDDDDGLVGSRLWLLDRSKQIQQVLNDATSYVQEAIAWLVDDGVVARQDVVVEFTRPGMLGVQITPYRQDGLKLPAKKYQYVWSQL